MKGDLTLCAFLLARLDEDEQAAKAALPGPWLVGTEHDHLLDWVVYGQSRWAGHLGQVCNVEYGHDGADNAAHIARHDPATVLADVAARRRIVEEHVGVHRCDWGDYAGGDCGECTTEVLRLLAVRYAGHPDHYSGWAPR